MSSGKLSKFSLFFIKCSFKILKTFFDIEAKRHQILVIMSTFGSLSAVRAVCCLQASFNAILDIKIKIIGLGLKVALMW